MYKLATLVSAVGLYAGSASGQGLPVELPQVTGNGGSGGDSNCNGCYVVADVAGVAFGTQTLAAQQTENVVLANRNGSTFTTTSIIFNQGQFTVGPSGVNGAAPIPTGAGVAFNTDGTTAVVNGVTLTSPTAYEVFTAYSVTSSFMSNGACVTSNGPAIALTSAFQVPIPQNADLASFQLNAEQSFVSQIGLPSCSPSIGSYQTTTQIPVNVTTTTITSSASLRATPMPVSVASKTISTPGPTGAVSSGFAGTPNNGSSIVPSKPTNTIAYAGAPRVSIIGSWMAGAAALLAGLVA